MNFKIGIFCLLTLSTACKTDKPAPDPQPPPVELEEKMTDKPPKPINVVGLSYFSTNYSIAPDMRSSKSMSLSGDAFVAHAKEVDAVLDTAQVAGVVTLRKYIEMKLANDTAGLAKVQAKRAQDEAEDVRPTGAPSIEITLHLEGDTKYVISDGNPDFVGSNKLIRLMSEFGSTSVSNPEDNLINSKPEPGPIVD